MSYAIPEFEPASSYIIEVTGQDVYLKLSELDREFLGTDDYLGFTSWWCGGDDYKHALRKAKGHPRKRIHDILIHNNIPLLQMDRTYDQQTIALQIYRKYL